MTIKIKGDVFGVLERLLHENGLSCPRCKSGHYYRLNGEAHRKGLLKCKKCYAQFSLTSGTKLKGARLSPKQIIKAMVIINEDKFVNIGYIKEELGVTYKTAYRLTSLIRESFLKDEIDRVLEQYVADKGIKIIGMGKHGYKNHRYAITD